MYKDERRRALDRVRRRSAYRRATDRFDGLSKSQVFVVASDFRISKTQPALPLRAGYRPKKPGRFRKRNDDRVDVEWLRNHGFI